MSSSLQDQDLEVYKLVVEGFNLLTPTNQDNDAADVDEDDQTETKENKSSSNLINDEIIEKKHENSAGMHKQNEEKNEKNTAQIMDDNTPKVSDDKSNIRSIQTMERKISHAKFKMTMSNIFNCIKHEMYPKIAIDLQSFFKNQSDVKNDDENILQSFELRNFDTNLESKLMKYLQTKKKLPIEEAKYLKSLINRARSFKPITTTMNEG